MARKLFTVLAAIYIVACIGALVIALIGIFGEPSQPLAGVFAIMLAMPWTILLGSPRGLESPLAYLLLLIAYMGINLAILWLLRRAVSRTRKDSLDAP